jgi:hypothetical protein
MGEELRGISIEQIRYSSRYDVPAVTVRSVCEEAKSQASPGSIDAVNRDGAHGIIDLHYPLNEERCFHNQDARYEAIKQAAGAFTNAQGAVIATRPASIPLHIMLGSGLPLRTLHIHNIDPKAPVAPASIVLTAITEICRSPPADVDPGLNPNHPDHLERKPREDGCVALPGHRYRTQTQCPAKNKKALRSDSWDRGLRGQRLTSR